MLPPASILIVLFAVTEPTLTSPDAVTSTAPVIASTSCRTISPPPAKLILSVASIRTSLKRLPASLRFTSSTAVMSKVPIWVTAVPVCCEMLPKFTPIPLCSTEKSPTKSKLPNSISNESPVVLLARIDVIAFTSVSRVSRLVPSPVMPSGTVPVPPKLNTPSTSEIS